MLTTDDYVTEEEFNPLADEGFELMGAAFEVHRVVRGGLLEEVYQESFEEELRLRGIPFVPRQELAVFYKGRELRQRYIPDLYVHGEIVVELKSVRALASEHVAQLLNYLRLARKPVGYLINFGPLGKVEWKRFVLREFVQPWMLLPRGDRRPNSQNV
jgi:GxxExxY protein